ncbi:glycerophosphodiester phosphodiesterase family protein [Cognatishimia sp. WU-CL00825]|uniref:glycerophosphodiester phosphodiesterase family protein n=1 Tax=Cognatishimia sp. WU-CL00825 TaxID=3127658 RepID=UPI003108BDDE
MTPLDPSFLKIPLAHRALHDVAGGRPENSRAAIRAAIQAGYGIEIDLQMSKDAQAMVFHDYDLSRLARADGLVANRSAAELAEISLIGTDEGIPNLQEILDLVAGQVPLLIELKDQDGHLGRNIGPLETATAMLLEAYQGPVAVMSFNPHSVAKMAALCPQVTRGLVTGAFAHTDWSSVAPKTCDHLRNIPDYERVQASFISHQVQDLSRERVAELKSNGADILCWTVTSAEIEAEARKIAQNITFEQYLPKLPVHPA